MREDLCAYVNGLRHEKNSATYARKVANCSAYKRMTELLLRSKTVDPFFEMVGARKIAIYGVEGLGQIFGQYVSKSNIHIECYIDKNYQKYNQVNLDVIGINEISNRDIDAIVISVLDAQCTIMKELVQNGFDLERIYTVNMVLYGISL